MYGCIVYIDKEKICIVSTCPKEMEKQDSFWKHPDYPNIKFNSGWQVFGDNRQRDNLLEFANLDEFFTLSHQDISFFQGLETGIKLSFSSANLLARKDLINYIRNLPFSSN